MEEAELMIGGGGKMRKQSAMTYSAFACAGEEMGVVGRCVGGATAFMLQEEEPVCVGEEQGTRMSYTFK